MLFFIQIPSLTNLEDLFWTVKPLEISKKAIDTLEDLTAPLNSLPH